MSEGQRRPILCLDFDGVLHAYTSGWQGATVIPDCLVPGAREFLADAVEAFEVCIFSTRSADPNGISAMRRWLIEQLQFERDPPLSQIRTRCMSAEAACLLVERIRFATEKPPAFVTIDDRALTFTGQWPAIADLKIFRTWWEKAAPNV